jgi:lactate permease
VFNLSFVLAVSPFVIFLILLLAKKMNLLLVSVITLGIVLLTQIFYWHILPVFLLNSIVKGFLVAFDIFIIIIGAIFFLEVLMSLKVIDNVGRYLESVLGDYRVQMILLAWFFENFIEGTAGFGTPSTIVAPLLVSLGLSPLKAVIVSLLGNSTSVAFGAAGTPIRVGFAGLAADGVPVYAALFNCVGILVPVFMLWVVAREQKEKGAHFLEALPFAIWSGVAFVIPSLVFSYFGQEFPSILGAVVGLILVLLTIKLKLFLPKTKRHLRKVINMKVELPRYKLFLPYLGLIGLLILGKLTLGSVMFTFPWGFKYSFNLFNPGFAFLLAGIPVALFWGKRGVVWSSLLTSWRRTVDPFLVIVSMSAMVQLMINSGNNYSGLTSSLGIIAYGFQTRALPLIAPFVGAFGSFITGSATVSNVMFGSFLSSASKMLGLNSAKILALELSGAATGNMIALADIMAAEAVVGLKNKTRSVLRGVIGPCLVILAITGILGLIFI